MAFFCCWNCSLAQNLIPNPGFEEYKNCPTGLRQLNEAKHWRAANAGTPELFHNCGFTSSFPPYEGEGMAGVILFADYSNSVEYLQVQLKEPLIKDASYRLSYMILVDDKTPIVINRIGAYFSKEPLKSPNWTAFHVFPQVKTDEIIKKMDEWQEIKAVFVAKGGEEYMTFGNFYPKHHLKEEVVKPIGGNWRSYYFVDNFELIESNSIGEPLYREKPPQERKEEWSLVLYFETDEYKLTPSEREKLEKFLKALPENLFQPIKLIGHTDADASFEYNYTLSQKRVLEIEKIIRSKGFNNTYTSWSGESEPLNKNEDPEAKALNRRVEIRIGKP